MTFKEKIIQELINLINRDDIKNEIKEVMRPVIDMLLKEIYPYLYLSVILISINFILHLGILIILLRNKSIFSKTNFF